MLQESASRYSQGRKSPICPLCIQEKEDMVHFLLRCPKNRQTRQAYLNPIQALKQQAEWETCSEEERCRVILNGARGEVPNHSVGKRFEEYSGTGDPSGGADSLYDTWLQKMGFAYNNLWFQLHTHREAELLDLTC